MAKLLLLLVATCVAVQQTEALVNLGPLTPWEMMWQPPVSNWLLTKNTALIPASDVLAWRKLGGLVVVFC